MIRGTVTTVHRIVISDILSNRIAEHSCGRYNIIINNNNNNSYGVWGTGMGVPYGCLWVSTNRRIVFNRPCGEFAPETLTQPNKRTRRRRSKRIYKSKRSDPSCKYINLITHISQ